MLPDPDPLALASLRVAGVALRGSGYPNAINTLRHLRGAGVRIEDQADWLPEGLHLWKAIQASTGARLGLYLRLMLGNAFGALRVVLANRRQQLITYVPYPAIFLLWWLSWLPKGLRPPLIADAYISIWDATVRDRGLLGKGRWADRVLHSFEMRALQVADAVLVDTVANREWMIDEFGLSPDAVSTVPLAIDDEALLSLALPQEGESLRVSFIGTFVPLHGIGVLIDAIKQVQQPERIAFHFIGDGQDATKVEHAIAEGTAGFSWERSWQGHDRIIAALAESDVSLGVFGGAAKAARVLPFKLYLALAAGRAVMTQQQFSLPEGVPMPPFFTPRTDPEEIASLLLALSADFSMCRSAAEAGRSFYQEWLGARGVRMAWKGLFERFSTQKTTQKHVLAQPCNRS
jgi:glycosyltransferase involved in cell wall biosynthesis